MKRVRVTPDAARELDQIWLYIAQDDIKAATRFLDELTARFDLIKSSPGMGRARDELQLGLRSHPVGKYIIYYRETRNAITIMRVVHGARIPKQFFNT